MAHAAGESASAWTLATGAALPDDTHVVVLEVADESSLLEVEERLRFHAIPFVAVREPDPPHFGALVALGTYPLPRKTVGGVLRRLRLLGANPQET